MRDKVCKEMDFKVISLPSESWVLKAPILDLKGLQCSASSGQHSAESKSSYRHSSAASAQFQQIYNPKPEP